MSVSVIDEAGMTVDVDQDIIRRKGDLMKIWHLYDFKTTPTQGGPLLSFETQREYDCAKERIRTLATTYFSSNMGSGNVVYCISNQSKWVPVEPESVGQTLWEVACGIQPDGTNVNHTLVNEG